jgi:hypothetical protein
MSNRTSIVASMTMWTLCAAHANEPTAIRSGPEQPSPRVKASYRLFSIEGLEGPMWLHGGQIDLYAVSQQWIRVGIEMGAGVGTLTWEEASARVGYGTLGLSLGVQVPGRITPFVEGRFAGGVLFGQLAEFTVGDVSLANTSAATWMIAGGVEAGVEVYLRGRMYVSGAAGWVHSTWRGIDVAETTRNESVVTKDLVGDSFTLKLGIGF